MRAHGNSGHSCISAAAQRCWLPGRATAPLFYCDENGDAPSVRALLPTFPPGPCAALIGPEGGFSPEDRTIIRALPFVRALHMGPRILRAETAALAALAHLQAWLGDGDRPPHFGGGRMSEILDTLERLYAGREDAIESWLAAQREAAPPPITASVDLRHSGQPPGAGGYQPLPRRVQ